MSGAVMVGAEGRPPILLPWTACHGLIQFPRRQPNSPAFPFACAVRGMIDWIASFRCKHLFMSRTPRHIFLPALLAATLAATAAAQQAKPIATWANLNQLVTGAEIRVTLANGKTLIGFMQRITTESLAINATTSQEMLSRPDIRRVELKRRGHRGRNTLIGLAIGTGAGLAVGAGADAKSRPGRMFPDSGKVVLSALGALVGTVIGVALPTGGWRDVYRAP